MDPTSSIPHGKSILGEDCLLWLERLAAGVEGVSGFLAEGSPPSPSEYGGIVSEVRVKVVAFVTDTISVRAACLL